MAIAELRVSLRDSFMSLSASVALLVLGILFGATSDTGAPPWMAGDGAHWRERSRPVIPNLSHLEDYSGASSRGPLIVSDTPSCF
jgi:hypothetical protein